MTRNNLRLIWADKIVLALAILLLAIPAFGWAIVALAAGPMGADHVLASIGIENVLELFCAVLAVWAMLRAVDFVAGGTTYKLFHAEPAADLRAVSAAEVPDSKLLAH